MSEALNGIYLTAHDLGVLCEAADALPQIKTDQLGAMALSEPFKLDLLKDELQVIASSSADPEAVKLAKLGLDSYDNLQRAAEDTPKVKELPWAANHEQLSEATKYYSLRIQKALRTMVPKDPKSVPKNLTTEPLKRELERLYRDGYFVGYKGTQDRLLKRADKETATDFGTLVSNFDWGDWEPGNAQVAALLGDGGPGLQKLLDDAGIQIKSIGDTTIDELSALLAQMAEQGSSVATISDAINELTDSDRADMIATTELARGVSAGQEDSFQANGISQFNWMAADGSCDDCLALEDGSPYQVGDGEMPPHHPLCRCTTTAVGMLDEEAPE